MEDKISTGTNRFCLCSHSNLEEKKVHTAEDADDGLLGTLTGFLNDAERRFQDKMMKLGSQLIANEKKLLEAKKYGYGLRLNEAYSPSSSAAM
jgi:hypothetical protein